MTFNPLEVERKWQNFWQEKQVFKFDADLEREKYYVLEMFPFPSGKIHMGHLRNYTIGDVVARFKKMQGFNILHPIGFDAFGLPAENAALQNKIHPKEWTYSNIDNMRQELKSIGFAYDWSREVITCAPEYYKHEQKIFLDFYKNNLAYQKESFVNWDPVDQTVLANEQVIDGRGWRSGALVEKRKLRQWFLRVSEFSEELLAELKNLPGWDERVLTMQEKWIGKSEGALIDFYFDKEKQNKIQTFTTRPDTIFGAAGLAISPHHPLASKLAKDNQEITDFINWFNKNAVDEQTLETTEKRGINTGIKVFHPFNQNIQLPVYIANFVLMDYGVGALFICPAHDQRDFEFAKKYNLPIKQVVSFDGSEKELPEAYSGSGIMINSDFLNGLTNQKAKELVINILEEKKIGQRQINYRLRDWGISRQRYWGCPIPIIYLEDGKAVAVDEKDLPITLPHDVEFSGNGNPLSNHPSWKNIIYQGKKAARETDTFDTFFESSWYFLRFASQPENKAFELDIVNKLLPVDKYIGGVEHAVLHLLYARFFTKALKKCGYLDFSEPFKSLITQGMVCHQTFKNSQGEWVFPEDVVKDDSGRLVDSKTRQLVIVGRSEKMSKSKKNVVEPFKIINKYGADTARLFMLSDTPPERNLEWSESGIEGSWKYINRLWNLVEGFVAKAKKPLLTDYQEVFFQKSQLTDLNEEQLLIVKTTHKSIALVGQEYEKMGFNRAIAKVREFSNLLEKFLVKNDSDEKVMNFALANLTLLISPLVPHLAEELWLKLGNKISIAESFYFPKFNPELIIEDMVKIAVQINGKLKNLFEVKKGISQSKLEDLVLNDQIIKKNIADKELKKIIFVPNKLLNIVV